ncbi:MAG TPA: hypothetical protein VN325_23350 [Steroidobacteraceae bacterium]|nr:hypothetical protein [Steroidobacteraceae bacterium]
MKQWAGKEALVDRVAQAWRDAYATAPRSSNEHLEAGKFLAMLNAVLPLEEIFPDAADMAHPAPPAPEQDPVALPSPEMVAEVQEQGPAEQVQEPAPSAPARIPLAEVDYADHSG